MERVTDMILIGLPAACMGVMLLTLGCAADGDEDHHGQQPTGSTCPPASTLGYQNFGQSFMATYCTDCHDSRVTGAQRQDAPIGVDYDTVEGIRAHRAEIDLHAAAGPNAINTAMPPSDPRPSEEKRRQLGEWLACGAP